MSAPTVGLKMQTVGNAPWSAIQSIPASVASIGSTPAMISPDTAPFAIRFAQYSIESKKTCWPSTRSLPGQIRANHSGSTNSRQNERWSTPSAISRS